MLKQYGHLILFCAIFHVNRVVSLNSTTYVTNNLENNHTIGTNSIITEGGGRINITSANITHHIREHGKNTIITSTIKPVDIKPKPLVINTTNTQTTPTPKKTIEAVQNVTTKSTQSKQNSTQSKQNSTSTEKNLTTFTFDITGDSKIKPRKGVNVSDDISSTTSTTTTPSTTTFTPRKPTVTFGSDDEPPLHRSDATKVILNNVVIKANRTVQDPFIHRGDVGERFIDNQHKKQPDYVLPIVLTILAVPLLAILLTVVYKRGAEWWHHRHYRRMDFLIDGMYNN